MQTPPHPISNTAHPTAGVFQRLILSGAPTSTIYVSTSMRSNRFSTTRNISSNFIMFILMSLFVSTQCLAADMSVEQMEAEATSCVVSGTCNWLHLAIQDEDIQFEIQDFLKRKCLGNYKRSGFTVRACYYAGKAYENYKHRVASMLFLTACETKDRTDHRYSYSCHSVRALACKPFDTNDDCLELNKNARSAEKILNAINYKPPTSNKVAAAPIPAKNINKGKGLRTVGTTMGLIGANMAVYSWAYGAGTDSSQQFYQAQTMNTTGLSIAGVGAMASTLGLFKIGSKLDNMKRPWLLAGLSTMTTGAVTGFLSFQTANNAKHQEDLDRFIISNTVGWSSTAIGASMVLSSLIWERPAASTVQFNLTGNGLYLGGQW